MSIRLLEEIWGLGEESFNFPACVGHPRCKQNNSSSQREPLGEETKWQEMEAKVGQSPQKQEVQRNRPLTAPTVDLKSLAQKIVPGTWLSKDI